MYKNGFLDKIQGALTFSAVGDALGWPTEFGRYPAIVKKRFGKSYLEDFIEWDKMVGGKFWGYRERIKEGEYSDDTQLTLAVLRCIDDEGNFDPETFSYFELPLWLGYERGGGKTIKTVARGMIQSKREWAMNFYTRKDVSYRNAGANGAAMRVLPIAVINVNNENRLYRDVFMNAIATHGHPRAIMGSVLYASAIKFLLNETTFSDVTFYQYLQDTVNNFSKTFKGNDLIHNWVYEWDRHPINGLKFKDLFQKTREEALEYLEKAQQSVSVADEEYYDYTGALNPATKGSGTATVLVAIYLFTKYRDDPLKALLVAVNMIGSDTDTIANFVGGLFGALYGLSKVPEKFLDKLQDREYILKSAKYLYDIVSGEELERRILLKESSREEALLKILSWEIGLHEMFWDALNEGDTIIHPALGRGTIKEKRIEELRRKRYKVKLIKVHFDCMQTCIFHSRITEEGKLSGSLAKDIDKTLISLKNPA